MKLTELPVSLIPLLSFPPKVLVLDSKAYLKSPETIKSSTVGKLSGPFQVWGARRDPLTLDRDDWTSTARGSAAMPAHTWLNVFGLMSSHRHCCFSVFFVLTQVEFLSTSSSFEGGYLIFSNRVSNPLCCSIDATFLGILFGEYHDFLRFLNLLILLYSCSLLVVLWCATYPSSNTVGSMFN